MLRGSLGGSCDFLFDTGIEATKVLRLQNNQVTIVALTANVMQKHRDLFNEAGCDGFLAKLIDKLALRRMLKKYLH